MSEHQPVKILKKTHAFLSAFCPETVHKCIVPVQDENESSSKRWSKTMSMTVRPRKRKCLKDAIEVNNLQNDTHDNIRRDLRKLMGS